MSTLRQSLAAAALVAAMGSAAHATDLYTPVLQSMNGASLSCAIVNVGSSPITVTASVRNFADGADLTAQAVCPIAPATLPPGHGCFANSSQNGFNSAYCHFTASNASVRGSLIIFGSDGQIVDSVPATR